MITKKYESNGKREEKDILEGVIFLTGEINAGVSESVIRRILEINRQNELEFIQMIINSCGGYTTSGFAIIDIMRWSRLPIFTTGIGMIASMGLLVFMTGDKGHRVVTPRTSILSHRFQADVKGSHSQLLAFRKEEDLMHKRIVQHYLEFSGIKTQKEIEEKLLRDIDVWLTPEEAVKYGLVDIIQNDTKNVIK